MAAANVEEVVRELGKNAGPGAVARGLMAVVLGTIKTKEVQVHADVRELLKGALSHQAGPDDVKKFLEANDALDEDDPLKVGRRSEHEKVALYTLLALASCSTPPAKGRRPALEGYAIAALEAIERLRLAKIGSSSERQMARAELFGALRQAAMGPDAEGPVEAPAGPEVHHSEGRVGRARRAAAERAEAKADGKDEGNAEAEPAAGQPPAAPADPAPEPAPAPPAEEPPAHGKGRRSR